MTNIIDIESRFKEVTGLKHLDLSVPHFQKSDNQQQKTTKTELKILPKIRKNGIV